MQDKILPQVLDCNNRRTNLNVIFFMKLAAKWPCLNTRIWYAQITKLLNTKIYTKPSIRSFHLLICHNQFFVTSLTSTSLLAIFIPASFAASCTSFYLQSELFGIS